jgi:hypothetical protein
MGCSISVPRSVHPISGVILTVKFVSLKINILILLFDVDVQPLPKSVCMTTTNMAKRAKPTAESTPNFYFINNNNNKIYNNILTF